MPKCILLISGNICSHQQMVSFGTWLNKLRNLKLINFNCSQARMCMYPLPWAREHPFRMSRLPFLGLSVCLKCTNDACHKVVGKSVKLQSVGPGNQAILETRIFFSGGRCPHKVLLLLFLNNLLSLCEVEWTKGWSLSGQRKRDALSITLSIV